MSVINPAVVDTPNTRDFSGCTRWQYRNVKAGDTCAAITVAKFAVKMVQVSGEFGKASVEIRGTCEDDKEYVKLSDASGKDIVLTSGNKIKPISECVAYLKTVVVGGNPDTDLTITVFCCGAS